MTDEERIELQMVDRYQERLVEAKRMKMWQDAEALRKEQALDALRKVPRWPDPEQQRAKLQDSLEILIAITVCTAVVWVLAWAVTKIIY